MSQSEEFPQKLFDDEYLENALDQGPTVYASTRDRALYMAEWAWQLQAAKVAVLEAELKEARHHIDRLLMPATWFFEGPYGSSPDKEDMIKAREFLAKHLATSLEGGEG